MIWGSFTNKSGSHKCKQEIQDYKSNNLEQWINIHEGQNTLYIGIAYTSGLFKSQQNNEELIGRDHSLRSRNRPWTSNWPVQSEVDQSSASAQTHPVILGSCKYSFSYPIGFDAKSFRLVRRLCSTLLSILRNTFSKQNNSGLLVSRGLGNHQTRVSFW